MQKHIDDMLNGEHIILVFPFYRDAVRAFEAGPPPQAMAYYSERMWKDKQSGGWILFGYAGMDCDKLRGILADIRFVSDADLLVTSQFKDFSWERSDRYAKHKKL